MSGIAPGDLLSLSYTTQKLLRGGATHRGPGPLIFIIIKKMPTEKSVGQREEVVFSVESLLPRGFSHIKVALSGVFTKRSPCRALSRPGDVITSS